MNNYINKIDFFWGENIFAYTFVIFPKYFVYFTYFLAFNYIQLY